MAQGVLHRLVRARGLSTRRHAAQIRFPPHSDEKEAPADLTLRRVDRPTPLPIAAVRGAPQLRSSSPPGGRFYLMRVKTADHDAGAALGSDEDNDRDRKERRRDRSRQPQRLDSAEQGMEAEPDSNGSKAGPHPAPERALVGENRAVLGEIGSGASEIATIGHIALTRLRLPVFKRRTGGAISEASSANQSRVL